ncbi:type II toxin-antitoxin system HicB family antitoxin (plasmid) [Leptospira interrogans]|uniref:type II toxin-antitoxin system HicB family antitoxin n=1 Tax=Leptospira interrogans TaxID=173 RepID=UPI001F0752DF|nr:type II toxin-antitoxin system HicB family antitoxin [Leptospira interrogans]UML83047.1 type II toxin-antitoxin system HicB family antitoxin [Leptospira interrogans]
MMISYPAILTEDKNEGGYTVEFPDLPGCTTEGDTLEEALAFAKDALSLYLGSIDSRKIKIPRPSERKGKNVFQIRPERKSGLRFS